MSVQVLATLSIPGLEPRPNHLRTLGRRRAASESEQDEHANSGFRRGMVVLDQVDIGANRDHWSL